MCLKNPQNALSRDFSGETIVPNNVNVKTADYWIQNLQLQAHPEGGFYKETYRASEAIPAEGLPARFQGSRSFSTSIYFLLRSEDTSLFHKIKSDELWHYHAGGTLVIYVLDNNGLSTHRLGADPEKGESLQVVIPAGSWFGAQPETENSYTLSGCTVAPGFDFQDFELASRTELLKTFPGHAHIIELLTK